MSTDNGVCKRKRCDLEQKAKISTDDESCIPKYKTEEAAGCDLVANVAEPVVIQPKTLTQIDAGFSVQLPKGTVGLLCIRSGLALNHKLCLMNQPGVLDSDYFGKVSLLIYNAGEEPYTVNPKDRLGQMVVVPYIRLNFEHVESIEKTTSRTGGFGSTGLN